MDDAVRFLALALLVGACSAATGHGGAPVANSEAHDPSLCVVPGTVDFGKIGLHSPSAPAYITITNCGKMKAIIDKISISDFQEFTDIDSCPHQPLALAPGAACSVGVRFFPDSEGSHQTDFVISSGHDEVKIHLAGIGVTSAAALSTTHVVFLPQVLGTQSKPTFVKIGNSSTGHPLHIDNVKVEGDFVLVPGLIPCPVPGELGPSESCSVAAAFTPHTAGLLEGRLIINDSDPGSPHVIGLNGTGTGIELTPTQLMWDRIVVGTAGEAKDFKIHGVGERSIQIEDIAAHGDFEQQNSCGKELRAGASCTVTVTFRPAESGKRVGSVSLTDSDPTKTQSVFLLGRGAVATLSPSALVFDPQGIGTASPPKTVTLKNYGKNSFSISTIDVSGDFAVPGKTCGQTLDAGQSCTLSVSFSPSLSGVANGFVAVHESGDKTPVKVTLTGTAAESAPSKTPQE